MVMAIVMMMEMVMVVAKKVVLTVGALILKR